MMMKPDKIITGKKGEPINTEAIREWLREYPRGAVVVTNKDTGERVLVKINPLGEIVAIPL